MSDKNKILVLLDDMRLFADISVYSVVSPEHLDIYSNLCNLIDFAKDLVEELLKEQEPVKLINERDEMGIPGGDCPMCLNWVDISYHYCPFCGRKVKWDE